MKVETKIERAVDKIREENYDRRMNVARDIGTILGKLGILEVEVKVRAEAGTIDYREVVEKISSIHNELDNIKL